MNELKIVLELHFSFKISPMGTMMDFQGQKLNRTSRNLSLNEQCCSDKM